VLAVGLKDRQLVGAYKTPTLRALRQTAPYFHNGIAGGKDALAKAVTTHTKGYLVNPFLDPLLKDPIDPAERRDLKLSGDQLHALLAFLGALDSKVNKVVNEEPEK
jgi:cytochrome c peroxidase